MSIDVKILFPPKILIRRSTCTQESEDCVRTREYVALSLWGRVGTGEWVLIGSRHGDCVG
eukprot:5222474-Prymnesium_polylepis.1